MPLPSVFIDRINFFHPNINISDAFKKKPLSIRINTLKTNKNDVQKQLNDLTIPSQEIIWCDNALLLPLSTSKQITETSLYEEGKVYIQSLSGMIRVLVLDPQPEEKVLDMAAAP